jgi:hypothetical protein
MDGKTLLKTVALDNTDLVFRYYTEAGFDLDSTQGLFSFNYYISPGIKIKRPNMYLFGLMSYLYICTNFEDFHNWKLVIYTDNYTYEKLKSEQQEEATEEEKAAFQALFDSGKVNPSKIPIKGRTFELSNYNYKQFPDKLPFSDNEKNIGFVQTQQDLLEPYKIYYDEYSSFDSLKKATDFQYKLIYYSLLHSPRVIWALCEWPSKEGQSNSINGFLMRCLRFRAPFDFPKQIHFIRDADTLMENYFQLHSPKLFIHSLAFALHIHESNTLALLQSKEQTLKKPILMIGTMYNYAKDWHRNNLEKRQASVGFLAGYVNISKELPCLTSDVWSKCMTYLNTRVYKMPSGAFSNEEKGRLKFGRDEQLLLFVIGPACINSLLIVNVRAYAHGETSIHITTYGFSHFLNKTPLNVIRKRFYDRSSAEPNFSEVTALVSYNFDSDSSDPSHAIPRFETFFTIEDNPKALATYKSDLVKWGMLAAEGGRYRKRKHATRKIVRKKRLASRKK